MSKTWLILDANYLAWRAYHSTGGLSYDDEPTGVVFGIFETVLRLMDDYATDGVVFAFDVGEPIRRTLHPGYKAKRHAKADNGTDAEQYARWQVRREVRRLRKFYLPSIGFRNVFGFDGYEADDVIAQVVRTSLPKRDEAVIVSADKDLYQLLAPNVSLFNPSAKLSGAKTPARINLEWFRRTWGMEPHTWAQVKALAGCTTDEIPGIPGIGETTAAKYFRAELKRDSAAWDKITCKAGLKVFNETFPLVRLPFEGTPPCPLREDVCTYTRCLNVFGRLGIKSLGNAARSVMPHRR